MFGTVVVGVGRAGQVRIRDLLTPLPGSAAERLSIKGFVSRRHLGDQQGVKQISLTEALDREDIQVAIVCTENTSHEDYIQKFLEAGKHVCVEYPMSLSHTAAVELHHLAEKKGKVLHEEHIELLTAEYKQLKKNVAGLNLLEGTIQFTACNLRFLDQFFTLKDFDGAELYSLLKMEETAEITERVLEGVLAGPPLSEFGSLSFSAIARLTWLVDLFGELTVTDSSMVEDRQNQYMKMTAEFLTKEQRKLTWIEERGPGLGWSKSIDFRFDSGRINQLPDAPPEPVGIFMQDLELFGRKLMGDVPLEQLQKERRRVLHCLQLAGHISQLCQSTVHNCT